MQLDANSTSDTTPNNYNLPEKWTLPGKLNQKYVNATKTSLIAPFSGLAREIGLPNTFAKIAKGVASYFVTLEASEPAKNFVSNCNVFGDTVKVLSFAKGVDDIMQNAAKGDVKGLDLHQKNLGIASGFFQMVISGMAGFKLLDTFKVLSLSKISEALGTTAVLPFSVVTNGFEIIKNVIDITNKSIKIHKTNQEDAKVKDKQNRFKITKDKTEDKANSEKIGEFLKQHIKDMKAKQKAGPDILKEKEKTLDSAKQRAEAALKAYSETKNKRKVNKASPEKVASLIKKLPLFIEKQKNKAELFEATAACDKAYQGLENAKSKLDGRVTKISAWKNVKNQFKKNVSESKEGIGIKRNGDELDSSDLVNQMVAEKTSRWNAKRDNFSFSNLKDGLAIALSVVATIGLIATIVLTFTGVGTIPVLLTMTTLWLILALAGLGTTLLDKYKKPLEIAPTNFRHYAPCAA